MQTRRHARPPAPAPSPSLAVLAALTAGLVAALVAGCASGGSPAADAAPFAELIIENDNPRIFHIYALRGGARFRLGTVNGLTTERFDLGRQMVEGSGELRIMVQPMGARTRHLADPIVVAEGDVVELTLSAFVR